MLHFFFFLFLLRQSNNITVSKKYVSLNLNAYVLNLTFHLIEDYKVLGNVFVKTISFTDKHMFVSIFNILIGMMVYLTCRIVFLFNLKKNEASQDGYSGKIKTLIACFQHFHPKRDRSGTSTQENGNKRKDCEQGGMREG